MFLRVAAVPFLAAALAGAQAPSSSSLPASPSAIDAMIDQIGDFAATYRATLPSLTADENITSKATGLGIIKLHDEAHAIFRVIRTSPDGPLVESRQITQLNGKSVEPGHEVHLPITFRGAFGDALEIFFSPALRPCFDFTLSPETALDASQRINFIKRPSAVLACARTPPGVAGFVRIDTLSKHIRHLERTVPEEIARPRRIAGFASVDYAPTQVGGDSLWLPTEIVARMGGGKAVFIAHYSNYHRFTGNMTIMPGVTEVDSTGLEPASTSPPAPAVPPRL